MKFCGLSEKVSSYSDSSIVILPVPFDKTSTWKKGSEKGPEAIIDASVNLELYDHELDYEVAERGIFTALPVKTDDSREMIKKVYYDVCALIKDKKFPVVLGGEHTVSLGAIRAFNEAMEGDFTVLHLDAHTDRREEYNESKFNHACVMARAGEITENIVSVGIRSTDMSEKKLLEKSRIVFAENTLKDDKWIAKTISQLKKNVYITIDLDVFDSTIMPSTGTPEPGGLSWYQVTDLIKEAVKEKNIIGFDVVELLPIDSLHAPNFLAAKLVYMTLSQIFYMKKERDKK